MVKDTCFIFAAGDFYGDISLSENSLIIAADAGYHHLRKRGIVPDILIGDFDTIGQIPDICETITFPCEKDYTDTELAMLEAIKRGYKTFVICGATGGKRLEHTIANIKLCESYAIKGYDITLTDGNYLIKSIHNAKLDFSENEKGFISVFSLSGKAEGVSINGLKYPLENATLDFSNPTLCVSNEFIGQQSSVSVENGTITIIWQRNDI